MKIHGLRIYPQSLNIVPGIGAPIFVHGSISTECPDFFYIFRPLAPLWRGHIFTNEFAVSYNEQGTIEDPIPRLREQFESGFLDADPESGLMLLHGDDYSSWGVTLHFGEGALVLLFRERPAFPLLKSLYWSRDFRLNSATWPSQMRSVLHMWDDIYWQLFTTDRSDIDLLIRAHTGDPKLKLFFVDFDREYPDPSNEELRPATLDGDW